MSNGDVQNKSANGARWSFVVMGAGLVATWGWMLWQAQATNTSSLERLVDQRLVTLKGEVNDHTLLANHAVVQQDGINALRGRVGKLEAWRETWIQTVPALDSKQNEQLLALEREIFPGWKRPP